MSRELAKHSGSGLPSIEKARALLTQCRSVNECMRIKALAQAVASCESAEAARNDAAAIVLLAKARIGELTREIPKVPRGGAPERGKSNTSKREVLVTKGLSEKQAAECEKIAQLKADGDLDAMIAGSKGLPTTAGAVALARMKPEQRSEVLAKLGDVDDVKKAIGEVKLDKKHALAAELASKPLPQVTGRFDVIVADPPWQYDKRAEDVTQRGKTPYPTMSTDEICALPIGERAEKNCILWLWTTNAFMRDALRILDAWGFAEKTILTWAKDRMGTGDWLRGKTEHCVLAVRGKPIVQLTNQTTLLNAPLREHSRKPDEFFALVEALCPGTKLELFAREARPGWQAWGAETEKFRAA